MIDNVAEHSKDFPMSWPADDKWEEWKQSYNKDRQYVSNAAKEIKKEVERVRNHVSVPRCLFIFLSSPLNLVKQQN